MMPLQQDYDALVAVSRVLSKVLRHEPELIGLRLDSAGWAEVGELLAKLNRAFRSDRSPKRLRTLPQLTLELLRSVVEGNEKKRFSYRTTSGVFEQCKGIPWTWSSGIR